jgi:hypothetical protein
MKKLLYARGEFIYVQWCCLREVSSDSQNADEAPRVPPRGPTIATTKATGQVLSIKASALYRVKAGFKLPDEKAESELTDEDIARQYNVDEWDVSC